MIESEHYKALKETFKLYDEYKEHIQIITNNINPESDEYNKIINSQEILTMQSNISLQFLKEYNKSNKSKTYFYGCHVSVYKDTFEKRLNKFLNEFIDSSTVEFLITELKFGVFKHNYPFVDDKTDANLFFSLNKRADFITDKVKELGYEVQFITPENDYDDSGFEFEWKADEHNTNTINWNGTPTELVELIKALIESDSIKGESQKNIIDLFSKFLNIDIKNPDKIIQDIKKRNNYSETLFLDKLKSSLYGYLTK